MKIALWYGHRTRGVGKFPAYLIAKRAFIKRAYWRRYL